MLACQLKNDHAPQPLSLLRASLARIVAPETRRATCYFRSEWPKLFLVDAARWGYSRILTHNLWRFPSRRTETYHRSRIAKTHGFIRRFSQVASSLGMPPTCPDSAAYGVTSSWEGTQPDSQAPHPLGWAGPINAPRQRSPGLLGYTGRRRLCPVIGCSGLVMRFMPRTMATPTKRGTLLCHRHLTATSEVYT